MTAAIHPIRERTLLAFARITQVASRFLLLSVALLCYGATPSAAQGQTEHEAQIQEEATASAFNPFDLRTKLRGSAHRRAGATVISSAELMTCRRMIEAASSEHLGPQLSLGLAVPLRC
ncbi:MAG: hypothetical protein H0T51_25005 [Pirellulales bacterium]|nr:hypothetical protein [Pirellulales bacterium]